MNSFLAKTPFLWAGSKDLDYKTIRNYISDFQAYHEPFVGGGAVYFRLLAERGSFPAYCSDVNPELIATYNAIKDDPEGLIAALPDTKNREDFNRLLAETPSDQTGRGARFLYLNRNRFFGMGGWMNADRYARGAVADRIRFFSPLMQETEFTDQGCWTFKIDPGSFEPSFKVPDRPSKLDAFADKLSGWLKSEANKSRKQKRTVKQLFADLISLGYDGSYGRVAAFAREWKADRQREQQTSGRGTFVPLIFQSGEAFQFDWSEDWAILGGERTKLQVAHFKLSHSRAFVVRAYLLQTHEMLFDAHYHAFRVLGGVPRRGIYDNMRTAVDRVGRGKDRQVNARFSAMVSHYLFDAEFCNPASGWEKGQVEKNVQDARHRLWQPMPDCIDLNTLNAWLEQRCIELWGQIPHAALPGTVADVWADEVMRLMPLPRPFDGFVEHTKRVSPTCLVHLERNRYSVPASFANRPVSVRVYPERVVIAAEGQILCEHPRVIERSHDLPGRTIYDWRHYLAVIQRKPGALRNGAPFVELPEAFKRLQHHLLKRPGGDREMVEILALVLQHDEQAVLCAVEMALSVGVPTKTHSNRGETPGGGLIFL